MSSLRDWEKVNCRMTFASFMTFCAPAAWGILLALTHGGKGENVPLWQWKLGCIVLMPIGIWRSASGWRRWLGGALLVVFTFWSTHYAMTNDGKAGAALLLSWLGAFYVTWYADGQAYRRRRNRRVWE